MQNRIFLSCLLAASFAQASAADLPPNVLVKSQWMELTRADYDAALARVPAKMRYEFAASPTRIKGLLNNMLLTKTLAAQARVHGTKPGSSFGAGSADQSERALADAETRRIEGDAAKAFDAQRPAFEAKAREIYVLDRDKYKTPEEIRLSDIAVALKDRGADAALARAREARQRVVSGADFAAVAREYSDDPTTKDKGGALPFVSAKSLTRGYAKAVFALTKIGEISEPIKAPAAYHVVRLEERRPARPQTFDEARDKIMQGLRQRYVAEQRDLRIQEILGDPDLRVNQAAVDALVTHIDPALMKPAPRSRAAAPAPK